MEEAGNLFSKFYDYCLYYSNQSCSPVPKTGTKTPLMSPTTSRAQKLQNSHKMSEQERGWFSVPQEYSWLNQGYPGTMEQQKYKHYAPSSQVVYNINRNCFQDLPIYQEESPVMPYLPHSWEDGEVESQNLVLEVDCVQILMYEKSNQRLAAEILANSRLNPNAEEFTPKTVIEKSLEETEDSAAQLDGQNDHSNGEEGHGHCSLEDEVILAQVDGHHELTDGDESYEEKELSADQDYFCDITFTDECENQEGSGDSSYEDEEEEDDDDWDWDSDEQSNGECVIVDPSDFEDLFTPSLLMTNLSSNCELCHHKPPASTNPKLREANKRFLQVYPDVEDAGTELTCKTVKFSNDPTIILEPENLAEELQLARTGEFAARQADRERMERLLAPILTETHRQNVYKKIYGESLK